MLKSTAANELSQALQDLRAMARTLDHPPVLTRQVICAVRARLDEIERLVVAEPSPSPMATSSASPPSAELIAAADDLIAELLAIAEDEGLADSGELPAKLTRWHAARQGRIEPSPSPEATSPASPLPPTSPDGAGASCGPLARAAGAAFLSACRFCGSPLGSGNQVGGRLFRCDACGFGQYA